MIVRPTTWTIGFLVIFMLFGIYVITDRQSDEKTVVSRRSVSLDRAELFKAVPLALEFHDLPGALDDNARRSLDTKPGPPVRQFQATAGINGHESHRDAPPLKRHIVYMAMDPVKPRMPAVRRAQKNYISSQKRPPDSKYNINVTLSDHISLDRKIDDTRPKSCRAIAYNRSKLPRASVIIPFYNEALSMLLRTIHSVLNRSPDDLLNEIILVDDHSTHEHLQDPLDRYVALLTKVKIIRNSARVGLIVSRMRGCALAKGMYYII